MGSRGGWEGTVIGAPLAALVGKRLGSTATSSEMEKFKNEM